MAERLSWEDIVFVVLLSVLRILCLLVDVELFGGRRSRTELMEDVLNEDCPLLVGCTVTVSSIETLDRLSYVELPFKKRICNMG
eukprot:scaffold4062_cov137-Cylindrotheca_fusiformis.AAC.7